MAYAVHLDNFEGPLDLLLYFIQRDKIDIYDIPIAQLAGEYLEYLGMIKALNLAVAGEFVVLAASLMRIKAKMLLPRTVDESEELMEDPRQELVDQLVNYQRFKSAAKELGELAELRGAYYPVGGMELPASNGNGVQEYLQDVSLFDLMSVFREVLGRMPSTEPLRMAMEPIKLDDQMSVIRRALDSEGKIAFKEILLKAVDRHEVVVTFLALLEMVKRQQIVVLQADPFGEIMLQGIEAQA